MNQQNGQNPEDDFHDILMKAFSAHGKTIQDIPKDYHQLKKIIPTVDLDPRSLFSLPKIIPGLDLPDGITRHIRPFGPWSLNIWTLQSPQGIITIDSGCTPADLLESTNHIKPVSILITHMDHDHTGGMDAYPETSIYLPDDFSPDQSCNIGGLIWKIHNLAGHTANGIGYETTYHGHTLFFPGDSIFARSIGKSRIPYQITINNIIAALNSLPDNTIICPGHGPATTVADEKNFNPFLSHHFNLT